MALKERDNMPPQKIPKQKLNLSRALPWCLLSVACVSGLIICYLTWVNFFAFLGKYQQTLFLWSL